MGNTPMKLGQAPSISTPPLRSVKGEKAMHIGSPNSLKRLITRSCCGLWFCLSVLFCVQCTNPESENQEQKREKAYSLLTRAKRYESEGLPDKAVTAYQQSLSISREIGNKRLEALLLMSLGNVYHNTEQYTQALGAHQQSLSISREIGDKMLEAALIMSLGSIYYNTEQYDQALAMYQEGLKGIGQILLSKGISQKELRALRLSEARALRHLAVIYQLRGQYPFALEKKSMKPGVEMASHKSMT
jgi:tetratricopeptide (TPR) repeat protein